MPDGRFVSYLRVSTQKQGAEGLGIEAQRRAVADFMNGGNWQLLRELVEVESGRRRDRPKLAEAIALCRAFNAKLVIAKLDRLSRSIVDICKLVDKYFANQRFSLLFSIFFSAGFQTLSTIRAPCQECRWSRIATVICN